MSREVVAQEDAAAHRSVAALAHNLQSRLPESRAAIRVRARSVQPQEKSIHVAVKTHN
jgi:hypothetical protein